MKVVITGTRKGRPDVSYWLRKFVDKHGVPTFIIGDAPGVDGDALEICRAKKWPAVRCLVNPLLPSPERFHVRNQFMVDLASPGDWCLAFPGPDSRGTYDCMRRAKERGLQVAKLKVYLAARGP